MILYCFCWLQDGEMQMITPHWKSCMLLKISLAWSKINIKGRTIGPLSYTWHGVNPCVIKAKCSGMICGLLANFLIFLARLLSLKSRHGRCLPGYCFKTMILLCFLFIHKIVDRGPSCANMTHQQSDHDVLASLCCWFSNHSLT